MYCPVFLLLVLVAGPFVCAGVFAFLPLPFICTRVALHFLALNSAVPFLCLKVHPVPFFDTIVCLQHIGNFIY